MAHPVVLAHSPVLGSVICPRHIHAHPDGRQRIFRRPHFNAFPGFADRKLVALDPMSVRNNRLETDPSPVGPTGIA